MMTGQSARVTPAEVSEQIGQALALPHGESRAYRIAYQERRDQILARMAADLDTPDAHEVAAEAWDQLASVAVALRATVEDAR
jgi:hypothetical protein